MMDLNDFQSRLVQIQRTFDAPINLVWTAWTQPEHIAQWWSPKGITTKVEIHEFKIGGRWKYIMPMPNGHEFTAEGVYTEIIEFEKIGSKADFRPMTEKVEIQALFRAKGDQTEFTFNIVHATEAYRIQQEKMGIQNGWGSVFNRLVDYLTKI